jgi:hypothetical protein
MIRRVNTRRRVWWPRWGLELRRILERLEILIMATEEELSAEITQIKTDLTSVGTALGQEIQNLRDKVAAGGVSDADLSALQDIHTQLTSADFGQPAAPAAPAAPASGDVGTASAPADTSAADTTAPAADTAAQAADAAPPA